MAAVIRIWACFFLCQFCGSADAGVTVDGNPNIGKTVNGIAVTGKANPNKYYLKQLRKNQILS